MSDVPVLAWLENLILGVGADAIGHIELPLFTYFRLRAELCPKSRHLGDIVEVRIYDIPITPHPHIGGEAHIHPPED